jgi:hypothetical protein
VTSNIGVHTYTHTGLNKVIHRLVSDEGKIFDLIVNILSLSLLSVLYKVKKIHYVEVTFVRLSVCGHQGPYRYTVVLKIRYGRFYEQIPIYSHNDPLKIVYMRP